ncbi:Uncharacterised protein [Mycobacteroides abscessus subsp. abscessus]|uniref:hypothetical protein n=1 Tax=Mycobacteroides abscessus TaxID=36809 RepID=UPI0009A5DA37|nr:hypothetical protein [Mycobacteroides abscessus]SLI19597.1 Uncharacterised protein [Mycobacteroides abscessus subsp. abscessus]
MNTETAQSRWPAPTVEKLDHHSGGQESVITYAATDGEAIRIRTYDDGEGRIVVTIYGTEGADIEVVEDDESCAAITVNPFRSPLPHTLTGPTDATRIAEAAGRHGWDIIAPVTGRWHRYTKGHSTMSALYARAGRLIYGSHASLFCSRDKAFIGADRADQFIAELAAANTEAP